MQRYPARVRFDAGGHYVGSSEPPGEFTWWDVGTWEQKQPGRVSISTANDAVIEYRVKVEARELTFTDPEGNSITYRRESSGK